MHENIIQNTIHLGHGLKRVLVSSFTGIRITQKLILWLQYLKQEQQSSSLWNATIYIVSRMEFKISHGNILWTADFTAFGQAFISNAYFLSMHMQNR